jgi:hypothetical protein
VDGTVILLLGVLWTAFCLINYDPPSGYNMGTGDSLVPLIIGVVLMLIGGGQWMGL